MDTDAINGFWNIQYEGNRVISRTPKHEPDIHPQIRLQDLDIQKGLQVTPEYPAGAGRLDFLLSGKTDGGQIINVCLEFKLAHAADLGHGILAQLPEYMARRATDFGIYCVLDFGQEYPFDANQFAVLDFRNLKSEDVRLDFILSIAAPHSGHHYLRPLIFDLSRKTSPSKS